mmetsp:Transcript_102715/g.306840  ORF Transcript_102715/g.306840 Transcript_102715/m.306840 type:complete len:319 (-) Transcript_102715:277-1233(-)
MSSSTTESSASATSATFQRQSFPTMNCRRLAAMRKETSAMKIATKALPHQTNQGGFSLGGTARALLVLMSVWMPMKMALATIMRPQKVWKAWLSTILSNREVGSLACSECERLSCLMPKCAEIRREIWPACMPPSRLLTREDMWWCHWRLHRSFSSLFISDLFSTSSQRLDAPLVTEGGRCSAGEAQTRGVSSPLRTPLAGQSCPSTAASGGEPPMLKLGCTTLMVKLSPLASASACPASSGEASGHQAASCLPPERTARAGKRSFRALSRGVTSGLGVQSLLPAASPFGWCTESPEDPLLDRSRRSSASKRPQSWPL